MPIPQKLTKFFEKNKFKYIPAKHRTVYTAFDKAATLKVKPNMIGKTLVLKIDKNLAVALIPANKNLDKNKFKKIAKTKKVDFVSERIIKSKLKGVKVGAIPPFGNLWGLTTFIDKFLINQPKIIVNGGDYNWSIKISPAALKKLIPDLMAGTFSKVKR
jgi:Ala-tRNA(Pro) deacylase